MNKEKIKKEVEKYMIEYWGERCPDRRMPEDNQLQCPLCKAYDCFDYLFPSDDECD